LEEITLLGAPAFAEATGRPAFATLRRAGAAIDRFTGKVIDKQIEVVNE